MPDRVFDSRSHSCCPAAVDAIVGGDAVINALGYWPCFHDGTLSGLSLTSDRSNHSAIVELTAQVQRMLPEVDAKGFYKTTDHALMRLRFEGVIIEMVELQLFPVHISSFAIVRSVETVGLLDVTLDTEGRTHFTCTAASVVEICRLSP
jgi:putative methionine-R-sulfoxide reductase with GAF domain